MLARREHARGELERKLRAHGHDREAIEQALARLEQQRLLSNARYAELYVRARIGKGYGPLRIRAELQERGVEDELAAHCLEMSSGDWLEHAARVRERRFGEDWPADRAEQARQMRFLQQRGFPLSQIQVLFRRRGG